MSKPASRNSQLLFSGQKCTKCLLETYVKRSLSLNDGRTKKHRVKLSKKVKKDEGGIQARRASSDSSTYRLSIERLNLKTTDCPKCREPQPASHRKIRKTPSRTKSFFRSFINVFSRKTTKVKGERALETDAGQFKTEEGVCGFGESSPYYTHRGKTVKKKHSLKKTLFSNVEKTESLKRSSTLASGGVDRLPDVVNRDSDNSYFECVSEELEWIVKAIQSGPKEDCDVTPSAACLDADSHEGNDTTERIIQLLKQHGDIMDEKIRRSGCVHAFLQRLSYSSFQQLADHYVAQIPSPLPQTTDASPELVRLAFTLDFTAKVAGLCSQTVGRIMGFGNQYLQDSFTQMCAAHRQISKDLEGQNTCDPD